MKTPTAFLLGLGLLAAAPLTPLSAQQDATATVPGRLSPDQLDELLGPIALYPDALIALILPAAATPSDIVLAARYLQGGNDPAQVDNQPWDDSVTALAHYPDVIQWMNQNLTWTQQLGDTFVAQPTEVMQSIQHLRTEARAAGTLTDTPQQQVVIENDDISIVPAQPDIIYVPRYDPEVVYVQSPGYYPGPFLTFGVGFSTGVWLSHDMDWGHHRIWIADRHDPHWRDHRDWRHPVFPGRPGYVSDPSRHPWNPPAHLPVARPPMINRAPPQVVRPAFIAGTPPRPAGWQRDGGPNRRPDNNNNNPRIPSPPAPPSPASVRSPVVPPLRGPVVEPFQQPLVQPFRPPQTTPPPPADRRGAPDGQQRERERGQRDRETQNAPGNRPTPPPAPAFSNGIRPTPPPASPPTTRVQPPPPRNPSDDDDKRKDRDRRD